MQSRWSDADARQLVAHFAGQDISDELAHRVYTTRLLGRDPKLVLHGGGNTSVKTTATDILGETIEALCVKGSGWDMAQIEPAGLPAVRLAPLRRLRSLAALGDEAMVNAQRANLLDSQSPNPSVETLLHAFLPHKFIDHTHATAVLSLTDQPDPEKHCREVFGGRVGYVPYIMPGFRLAKAAANVYEMVPEVDGLILLRHGIFSFGDTAQQAYELMIELVTLAEERLASGRRPAFAQVSLPTCLATAQIAPIVRGALAVEGEGGAWRRFILDHRAGNQVMHYVNGEELARYSQVGVATPDHVIRTKATPLILPAPRTETLDEFKVAVGRKIAEYGASYRQYFARQNAKQSPPKQPLDPLPRVFLVPGVGLFGAGTTAKAASVAADITECTIETVTDAEAIGAFGSIGEEEMFEIEYWSLEQAKLGKSRPAPLEGQIALVTGGAGTIGAATAKALASDGAVVAVLDRDASAAAAIVDDMGQGLALACDVTEPAQVEAAFEQVCARFGGVDIVISNAGAAWQGGIAEVADDILRASFELNFFAHQTVTRAAIRIMRAQRTGGALLYNASKQAVNPGPDFGPYGLPKAAALSLMRQVALEHGADGIRANAVNADRIRGGLLTDAMISARSKARGLSEEGYMSGNLLGREVTADDVAQAFVYLAGALKTTGAVITVDGGNVAAMMR